MIVAVSHFNMGAMENKGLNVFNAKYVLARPDTATDQDFAGIEGVIAHEYFHNWTGNRITCRDWFQLSLKEGFTVYRDQEFSADRGSRGRQAHPRRADAARPPVRRGRGPPGPPGAARRPISRSTTSTPRPSTRRARNWCGCRPICWGPRCFRRATDLYFSRHDGQAVTTDDFVACMEDASGRDLDPVPPLVQPGGDPGTGDRQGRL